MKVYMLFDLKYKKKGLETHFKLRSDILFGGHGVNSHADMRTEDTFLTSFCIELEIPSNLN